MLPGMDQVRCQILVLSPHVLPWLHNFKLHCSEAPALLGKGCVTRAAIIKDSLVALPPLLI